MRWSARRAAALLLPLLLGATGGAAFAIESFLDGNPKAPEAIPHSRRAPVTPPATQTPPATPPAR